MAAREALELELSGQTSRAVEAAFLHEDFLDGQGQRLVLLLANGRRAFLPGVESAAGDNQEGTELLNGKRRIHGMGRVDQGIPGGRVSLERPSMPKAFFRMSWFCWSWQFSRLSRWFSASSCTAEGVESLGKRPSRSRRYSFFQRQRVGTPTCKSRDNSEMLFPLIRSSTASRLNWVE